MKKGKFYIVRCNMTSRETNADWVNGYIDQLIAKCKQLINTANGRLF